MHFPTPRIPTLSLNLALCGALGGLTIAAAAGAQGTDATPAAQRVQAEVDKVLESYLIGPKAASELGCRVKWQTRVALRDGVALKMVSSSPRAVLALTGRNELTLVRPDSGDIAWVASAADPVDRVVGLGVFDTRSGGSSDSERIAVMTDAVYYVLGFDSGSTLRRDRFVHVPNTTPEQVGNSFVYGTSAGQLSWLNCATGNDSFAHAIDALRGPSPVVAAPALAEGAVVGGNLRGGVIAIEAASGRLLWTKRLLAGVRATPAVANGIAFVSSDDQYLYAFDLASGEELWKYFTQTPLSSSPFAAGDIVVQDVPGEGLVALTQNPDSKLGGEVRWRRPSVMGTAITTIGDGIVFWCAKCRAATIVSMKDGSTIRKVELPAVTDLEADTLEPGGFVAWGADGRVERLAPIARATASSN